MRRQRYDDLPPDAEVEEDDEVPEVDVAALDADTLAAEVERAEAKERARLEDPDDR